MLEEWMQLVAHTGYFTVAVWFVVPVLAIISLAWWLLDLRYESRGDQRRYLRKAMPITGAGVLAVMVVWGLAATRDPSADELARAAKLGSHSAWDAAQLIGNLRDNGVGERGVTGAWQVPTRTSIAARPEVKREKLTAALAPGAVASNPPSHEQLCEIMRLLIGTAEAEPDGDCVLPAHSASVAKTVSNASLNG